MPLVYPFPDAVFSTNLSLLDHMYVGPGGSREISITCVVCANITEYQGAISMYEPCHHPEILDLKLVAVTGWNLGLSHLGSEEVCSGCGRILGNQKDILY